MDTSPSSDTVVETEGGEDRVAPPILSRYVVLDSLGAGGMGFVYAAYDPKLDRKVAIKILRTDSGDKKSSIGRSRLLREAQSLAQLSHPNVVQIHDVDTHEGQVFIAMEYVEGGSLKSWATQSRRGWREIRDNYIEAGRGLAAAHAVGITHRDFKPANVLVGEDGRIRVADFGLAKGSEDRDTGPQSVSEFITSDVSVDVSTDHELIAEMKSGANLKLTRVGRIVGTPAYMAPEQFLGIAVGPHTDQFAFCIALFEALYGVLPFQSENYEEHLAMLMEGNWAEPTTRPGSPGRASDAVPKWVQRVIVRGLSPQKGDRWPDMNALLSALVDDPDRRRRRWITRGVIAGSLAAGLAGFALRPAAPDPCLGAEEKLTGVWDAAIKSEIESGFRASNRGFAQDTWTRVEKSLDAFSGRWVASRVEVCRATHVRKEQSEALLDVRVACLDRHLEQLSATADILSKLSDDELEHAIDLANDLDDPTDCRTSEPREDTIAPPPEESAHEFEALLAQSRALERTGRFEDAAAAAVSAVSVAENLDYAPFIARAKLAQAEIATTLGEPLKARDRLHEILALTSKHRLARLEATAWMELVFLEGSVLQKSERGGALLLPAENAVLRVRDPGRLRQKFLMSRAGIEVNASDFEAARKSYVEAIADMDADPGADPIGKIDALGNLGVTLARSGQMEQAREVFERALEAGVEAYGPDHPEVASWHHNLANAQQALGKREEATKSARRALEIRESAMGPDHPSVADTLVTLGSLDRQGEKYESALAAYRRANEIFERRLPPDHARLGVVSNNIGLLLFARGEYDQAADHYQRSRAIFVSNFGEDHDRVANTDFHLCDVRLAQRRFEEARTLCQRALEVHEKRLGPDSPKLAGDLERLAKTLDGLGESAGAKAARNRAQTLQEARQEPPKEQD